ncbi:MAG: acyl-CoA dehydrogenase family protein [Burkholderiaceae bacterium]|nr:acyl-CoA dehydrogenase family protein [Burkholderiaceae bacterium]
MNFDLPSEYETFRKTCQEFARKEVAPLVAQAEEREQFPRQLLTRMGELGLLCLTCPETYGGPGGDIISQCIFTEELGYVCLGIAVGTMVHSAYAGSLLVECGTEEQKQRYLPAAAKGKEIWAFAGSESDAGHDRGRMKTSVRKEGERFILNGTKMYISNSTIADFIIVEAYTDKSKGLDGLSLFILPKTTPGLTVTKISKVGIRCSEIAALSFQDCVLPLDCQLGALGIAFEKVRRIRAASWLLVAARAIGVARAAFDAALDHAKNRVQFGRPIGHYQANSFKLADMAVDLEAARLLMMRAAWLHNEGRECFQEASMVKLFASEMAVRITGQALQMQGAEGYMMDSPLQRFFRDAKMLTLSEGSSEIQHIHLARGLGLKADDFYA